MDSVNSITETPIALLSLLHVVYYIERKRKKKKEKEKREREREREKQDL